MIVVNFGGGKNSTALIIETKRRGIVPDIILFADTGDEKPETYDHLHRFSLWLRGQGFPPITVVRCERRDGVATLELECPQNEVLPSKAYGYSGCSVKWKVQPQDKYLSQHPGVLATWARGERVERWLGFHAAEPHRAEKRKERDDADPQWHYRYPLIEWDLDQTDCERILQETGFVHVCKSACFYCPSSKPREIRELAKCHPDLLERALVMERTARPHLTDVKGLGRSYAWEDLLRQVELPFGSCEIGSGPELCDTCYDGD